MWSTCARCTGADWLVAHLLDGDLASNHLSWQWVAGTGSHKPYLFNAENVARYAPAPWHSPGSVLDTSYEALERLARGMDKATAGRSGLTPRLGMDPFTEPGLHSDPPAALQLKAPDADLAPRLEGRDVWLVHPWAIRLPPSDLPADVEIMGVYLKEHHEAWPWTEARWSWVDAAMAEVTSQRWVLDAQTLAKVLAGAARVRTVSDPHLSPWIESIAQLDPPPSLFAPVEQSCRSFSQWWTRSTRGLNKAEDLL